MKIDNRKNIFLVLFAGLVMFLVGLTVSGGFSAAMAAGGMMDGCIAECNTCGKTCDQLLKGVKDSNSKHANLLRDCSEMCKTSAQFMKRGSEFHPQVCRLCSDICKKCAESCDAQKDKESRACAEECRKCAASCEKMAS
ncbi:MAG TPA: four-helix bundle copper-binding protein [Chroococcales cyanobacterium]